MEIIVPAVLDFVMGILLLLFKVFIIEAPMIWVARAWGLFGISPLDTIISITALGMAALYYAVIARLVWDIANRFVGND